MIEDDFSRRYGDLLTGSYDCVDRIVLNAYMSLCHSPGGFRVWWRRWHDGSDDQLDNTHLMRMAGRFSRRVRAFAGAHGIPLVDCGRGERKHRIAEEYLATHTVGPGLFLGTSVSEGWSADDLAVRVAELEVRVAQLFNELADVTVLMTDVPVSDAGTPSPRYDTLDDWVREYFAPTFGRPIGGEIRWCAHWREHAEAIGRLEALWRSWEALRLDPAMGMVTWLTNYLDPQLAALLSRTGPFPQCALDRHVLQPPSWWLRGS